MQDNPYVKPGVKTSEFYIALVFVIGLVAKLFGLDVSEAEAGSLVYAGLTIAGAGAVIWNYISKRSQVKTDVAKLELEETRLMMNSGEDK